MKAYASLLKPRTFAEHRSVYLFQTFCDYIYATEGTSINIAENGIARLMYTRLVHWFNTVGRQFFTEINNYDTAEFVLFCNTGISEFSDLQKIFSDENVGLFFRENDNPPFHVAKPEIPEYDLADDIISIIRPTVDTMPETETSTEASESASDALSDEDDTDYQLPEKKRSKRTKYSGITRTRGQHLGINVGKPIRELSLIQMKKTDQPYFILHGKPGADDVVVAYPLEPGKTFKDYCANAPSWKDPYLLAIRHHYKEMAGCSIIDIRKVRSDRWFSLFRKKYLAEKKLAKKEAKKSQ